MNLLGGGVAERFCKHSLINAQATWWHCWWRRTDCQRRQLSSTLL